MKRYDFTNFEDFHESGIAYEYEALTVIKENGWVKADMLTECKSWRTALRRFFKLLTETEADGWRECMEEGAEGGTFKLNDAIMADGSRNPCPCYAYEIEEVSEGVWYIFLNIHPGDYDTTETTEDTTETAQTDTTTAETTTDTETETTESGDTTTAAQSGTETARTAQAAQDTTTENGGIDAAQRAAESEDSTETVAAGGESDAETTEARTAERAATETETAEAVKRRGTETTGTETTGFLLSVSSAFSASSVSSA